MITISTAYNAMNHASGEPVIRELMELGFGSFELSVKLSQAKLNEIESRLLQIEIASLHNFCPVPHGGGDDGSGDFYNLSSVDPKERKQAVEHSKVTLDWAHRLGARAVVFHFGRVENLPNSFENIAVLKQDGRDAEAQDLLMEDLQARELSKGPYLEAGLESLQKLVGFVQGAVQIGVETRYHYHEIPLIDEVQQFLDVIPEGKGGYWHDFGHAWMQDYIGVAKHEDYLKRYGARTVGMHVHDVDGLDDHGPLTLGTIDFARLLPLIPRQALSVLEIHRGSGQDLIDSRNIWRSLLARNQVS